MKRPDQFCADCFDGNYMGKIGMVIGCAATPDQPGRATGTVPLSPQDGTANRAFEQAGELVVARTSVITGATGQFILNGLQGSIIPKRFMFSLNGGDLIHRKVAIKKPPTCAEIMLDLTQASAHISGIEGIREDALDGLGIPPLPSNCRNMVGVKVIGYLMKGFSFQEHVFHEYDKWNCIGVLDGNGFSFIRLDIPKRWGNGLEAGFNTGRHSQFISPAVATDPVPFHPAKKTAIPTAAKPKEPKVTFKNPDC